MTLDEIDELMDDDHYSWAFQTLSGIRETIVKTGIVTERQADAVNNIRQAVSPQQRAAIISRLPSDRFKGSRRYEGFEGEKSKKVLDKS